MGCRGAAVLTRLLGVGAPGAQASPALVSSSGVAITYGQMADVVERGTAELVREGVGPGVAVAIAVPDAPGFILAALAAWEAGAAVVPLDLRGGAALVDEAIGRSHAQLVVRGAPLGEALRLERRQASAIDPRAALVLFTSGSTGRPKGVLLGGGGLRANVEAILRYLPVREHSRTALTLPLAYSYALVGQVLTTLRAGATLLLLHDLGYPAVQLEAMVRLAATGLSSVPTALRLLARAAVEGGARPRLGYVASAGAALEASTAACLRAAFPEARLFNQYGLTEASPRVAAIDDRDPAFAAGAAGRALPGLEVWAAREDRRCAPGEEGDLRVRGESVMLGYLDDLEASAKALAPDGSLRTGDRGHLDAGGAIFVAGRSDGVVKVAGERVGLEEIAICLREGGARDAAVVALPDEMMGARLVAFVEASEGAIPSLRATLRERLAPAKRPTKVIRLETLPRLPSGKIDLQELQRRAAALVRSS